MIQETTLRMIVQAVDQTAALDNVTRKLDSVDDGLDNVKKTASDALPSIGKGANELSDDMGDLGDVAAETSVRLGPGMVEAVAVAGVVFVALIDYINRVIDEHTRLTDVADRLDLPYNTVKSYSEAWTDVAVSLNDAARGYKALGDAQAAALKALGLSPGNLNEVDRVRKLVAIGEGTRQEKIDVFRRLFGQSYEDAAKTLDEDMRKLLAVTNVDGRLVPQFEQQGLSRNLNVSQLLSSGRLPAPETFKDRQEDQRTAESAIREINASVEREREKARRAAETADRAASRAALERQREEYDAHVAFVYQATKIEEAERKSLAKVVEETDREMARSSNEAWRSISEQTNAQIRQLEFPVNQFAEAWKNAMKDAVYFSDFSVKRLVARIIIELGSRKLFDAIDRVGDAMGNALDKGGGFLKGVGSFLGGIFGNAGGGQESGLRWVGEEGPELVASGPNAMRVYNMRQMAFAGGGPGGAKQTIHYHDNRKYEISGVETQQVIGYVEQTRREDQRGIVRMLERNGYGSMR